MSESDSSMSTSKMITLKSSDGTLFLVPETVAKQSKTISHIIEDIGTDAITSIPLPNVRSPTLAMVIHYCNKHVQFQFQAAAAAESSKELRDWDMQFLDHVDKDTLYDLIMAADYLHIQGLLDVTCQKVADMITGKNPEMIRHIFNIKNDFTPKEEEEIRCENLWAFQ